MPRRPHGGGAGAAAGPPCRAATRSLAGPRGRPPPSDPRWLTLHAGGAVGLQRTRKPRDSASDECANAHMICRAWPRCRRRVRGTTAAGCHTVRPRDRVRHRSWPTMNSAWAAVAASPIGTTSKTTKLFQNTRLAAPSSTCTRQGEGVPEAPAVVRGDREEQQADQQGEPVVLHPSDGVRRVVEHRPERTGAGVVAEQFEHDLGGSDHGEEDPVDQHHPPPSAPGGVVHEDRRVITITGWSCWGLLARTGASPPAIRPVL